MKTLLRYALGAAYLIFGLNFFFHFIPVPPLPEKAMHLMGAMIQSGYLMQAVKVIEIVCGALLIANLFTPLALVVLAPITLNIVLFHAFLAPSGIILSQIILIVHLVLAFYYREAYRILLMFRYIRN